MKRGKKAWFLVIVGIVFFHLSGGIALAEATVADVSLALQALRLSSGEEILEAFKIGFSQGRLLPDEALHLVERLTAVEGAPADKEAILLTIAHALEDDLPVTTLVNKVAEGLARGVPLPRIEQGISRRGRLLAEVRDLLYSKGIFSVSEEAQAVSPSLPVPIFDLLVTHIADALGDYLEGGGSPLEGHLLFQEVSLRLSMLKGVVIPTEAVELALNRIGPADLTRVVLKVLDQSSR